jgi:hypothetical protein
MRCSDGEVILTFAQHQLFFSGRYLHRLLPEDHAPVPGATRDKVLRTLVHKIPTQMRKADQIKRISLVGIGKIIVLWMVPWRWYMRISIFHLWLWNYT